MLMKIVQITPAKVYLFFHFHHSIKINMFRFSQSTKSTNSKSTSEIFGLFLPVSPMNNVNFHTYVTESTQMVNDDQKQNEQMVFKNKLMFCMTASTNKKLIPINYQMLCPCWL